MQRHYYVDAQPKFVHANIPSLLACQKSYSKNFNLVQAFDHDTRLSLVTVLCAKTLLCRWPILAETNFELSTPATQSPLQVWHYY